VLVLACTGYFIPEGIIHQDNLTEKSDVNVLNFILSPTWSQTKNPDKKKLSKQTHSVWLT